MSKFKPGDKVKYIGDNKTIPKFLTVKKYVEKQDCRPVLFFNEIDNYIVSEAFEIVEKGRIIIRPMKCCGSYDSYHKNSCKNWSMPY